MEGLTKTAFELTWTEDGRTSTVSTCVTFIISVTSSYFFLNYRYCAVCEFPKRMNLTMRGLCSTGKLKTPRTVPAYHITP